MYRGTKTTPTIQASPTHSYILRNPISRGSPQVHLGKHRDNSELKTLTNNAFWLIRQGHTAHPHSCSPIWRQARGQGGPGVQGHPKASWQRVGAAPEPHSPPLNWICSSSPHVWRYAFVLAATSVEKHFWKNTHKTTSLTGRASIEVCKTVKVYVNNEINTYVSFFRATHGSIIIQMCFGLKNSLWIWVWAFFSS